MAISQPLTQPARSGRKWAILIICFLLLLPAGAFGAFALKCKAGQLSEKRKKQTQITAFEKMKLASFDTIPVHVYLGGDCVDSSPYVQVDKQVATTKTVAEVTTDMRQTLTEQNFVLSKETMNRRLGIRNVLCGESYTATATGNGISFKVWFKTYDESKLPRECGAYGEQKITIEEAANEKVTLVSARLN